MILGTLACNSISFFAGDSTPTPTTLPSPTSFPTQTPMAVSTTVPNPHILEVTKDQFAFVDDVYGYRITMPAGWLLVDLINRDLSEAIQEAGVEDPAFVEVFRTAMSGFPAGLRFLSFQYDQERISGLMDFGPYVTLFPLGINVEEESMDGLMAYAESLVGVFYPSAVITERASLDEVGGRPAGYMRITLPVPLEDQTTVSITLEFIFLSSNGEYLALIFSVDAGDALRARAIYSEIIESVRFFE